jgi:hypothetical protein
MPLQPLENYLITLPDPAEQARKSLEYATGLAGTQMQLQNAVRQQSLRQTLSVFAQNPTHDAAIRILAAHPELSEKFKPLMEQLSADEKKAQVDQQAPIYNALLMNAPDVAVRRAEDFATAYDNSGMPEKAKGLRELVAQIKSNPALARLPLAASLNMAMGPEAFQSTFNKAALFDQERDKATAEAVKAGADATTASATADSAYKTTAADLLKKQSDAKAAQSGASYAGPLNAAELASRTAQADASRAQTASAYDSITDRAVGRVLDQRKFGLEEKKFGLESDKANREATKLDADGKKELGSAVESIQKANALGFKVEPIAKFFEDNKLRSGAEAYLSETWKSIRGSQDDETKFRGAYEELRNAFASSKLPPGSASDTDVQMALAGMPSANANADQIAQFLRGLQKAQRLVIDSNRAKYDWISANGSLKTAERDFTAAGRRVKVGDAFPDLLDAIAPKAAAQPQPVSGASRGVSRAEAPYAAEHAKMTTAQLKEKRMLILKGGR